MNKKKSSFTALIIFLCSFTLQAQPIHFLDAIRHSVFKIRANWLERGEEFGTGFVVDSTATTLIILTNRHVVAKQIDGERWQRAPQVSLFAFDRPEQIEVKPNDIEYFQDGHDLAIMRIERRPQTSFDMLLISRNLQYDGTPVTALTYPVEESKPHTVPGVIEARDGPYYRISFRSERPFTGGESGAPIVNERQNIVALVTQKSLRKDLTENEAINSPIIIEFLARLNIYPPRPDENQIIALMPITFEPQKKAEKWSRKFAKHLEKLLFELPDVSTMSSENLSYILPWIVSPEASKGLTRHEFSRLPSYMVRGHGKKMAGTFVLDFYLLTLPGEQVVLSERLIAKNVVSLADSASIVIAKAFGYDTEFVGVSPTLRKWSLRVAIAGAVATPFLINAASGSKNSYSVALTRVDAESRFSSLRRDEILRNSVLTTTALSFGFWINAALINPRMPLFEKEEVRYVTFKR